MYAATCAVEQSFRVLQGRALFSLAFLQFDIYGIGYIEKARLNLNSVDLAFKNVIASINWTKSLYILRAE